MWRCCTQSQLAHYQFWFSRWHSRKLDRKALMKVARIKGVMSTQWALNPSEQPGPLLPPSSFLSDNSYIWGRNADEVSHWGGSDDEPATDTTCFHGTDAQLPFFHPTFSLLSLLPFKSYHRFAEASHFPASSPFASAYLFSISLPASSFISLSLSLSFPLFPSPSFLSDIWANNQCHFILVREQMEFQLRAWQQAVNKGFSVTLTPPAFPSLCSRDPSLQQVSITSSHTGALYTEAHPDPLTINRMWVWTSWLRYSLCFPWLLLLCNWLYILIIVFSAVVLSIQPLVGRKSTSFISSISCNAYKQPYKQLWFTLINGRCLVL